MTVDDPMHAQRIEAIGTLAAGLAHEMNNVLAAIIGLADNVLDECAVAAIRTDLEQIVSHAERGAELTRSLLAFSRKGQYRTQTVALDDLVRRTRKLLAHTLPRSIEVATDFAAGGVQIEGDPVQLVQVLVNLSLNGADAMSGHGRLAIASGTVELADADAARCRLPAGRYARLDVTDTGCGMDADTVARVFEPFFTTKPVGRGTGLGLSVAWGVVEAHAGSIAVASVPGHGTTFTIYLPISARAAAPVERRACRARRMSSRISTRTVLVVDDEPAVRRSTVRTLERAGFAVLEATDGLDALRTFDAHTERIGLVMLDMGMPKMGGRELFERLRKVSRVPVLISTGYADDRDAQVLVGRGAALIEKPQPATTLVAEVTRLLQHTATEAP